MSKKIITQVLILILLSSLVNAQPIEDRGITSDSFLWGLDRALEKLSLLLTFDKTEKAKKGLDIGRERLSEFEEMIKENKLGAAEKARIAHGEILIKVRQYIKEIDDTKEIEEEFEDYEEESKKILIELKANVEIKGEKGEVTNKEYIDIMLNSLEKGIRVDKNNPPFISTIKPSFGAIGTEVTIEGKGFTSTGNSIKFRNGYLNNLKSDNRRIIRFVIPQTLSVCPPTSEVCILVALMLSSGEYDLSVINENGVSNSVRFTIAERSTQFRIRDRVRTTRDVKVMTVPSLFSRAPEYSQPKGMVGTIIEGPVSADVPVSEDVEILWEVDYDRGPDGWSVEDSLEKTDVITPIPTPITRPEPIPTPVPIVSATISIDENIKHQIMEGFASEPVTPGFTRPGIPKIYIPPAIVKELYKIYHTDLGYTHSHFDIGIDEPVNDNADPLSFDWTKFTDNPNDDDHLGYLSYGQSIGLQSWFTFGHHWGTLLKQEWLLDDELSPKGQKYKLKEGMEEEYVENLLAQVLTYKKLGINVPYTGVYNEPVWSNNNGRSITPAQMVTIVKRLGQRLAQENLSTKIHVPEDLSLSHAMLYINALLADPEARIYIGAFSYHTYQEVYADQPADAILHTSGQGNPPPRWVALRAELKQLSKHYGIPVWMTEVSGTTGTPHKIALARANHIHDEFTLADASLFVPEDFIAYKYEAEGEPVNELIGVVLDSTGNYKSHKIMKGGYMMSQYAKFVRPGDVRIDAKSSDKKVRVTAFKNPVNGEIKIVAINNNAHNVQTQIDFTEVAGTLTVLHGLRTSADENWAQVMPSVSGNTLTLVLTPESITSLTLIHSKP